MTYRFKKVFFFSSAAVSLPFLLYLSLLNLYCFDFIKWLAKDLLHLRYYFEQDTMMGPIFISLGLFTLFSIIYLIFYRRECHIGAMICLLFTGTVNALSTPYISSKIFRSWRSGAAPTFWYIILCIYAMIAFTAFIWLIVAMVKYPKSSRTSTTDSYV